LTKKEVNCLQWWQGFVFSWVFVLGIIDRYNTSFPLPAPLIRFNNIRKNNMENKQELYGNMNIKELHKCSVTSKEVIDRDTIWLVYYDKDNDELFRMRIEKVKERWAKEAEYYADKYNDEKEGYK
jgi:hypothetical protein